MDFSFISSQAQCGSAMRSLSAAMLAAILIILLLKTSQDFVGSMTSGSMTSGSGLRDFLRGPVLPHGVRGL